MDYEAHTEFWQGNLLKNAHLLKLEDEKVTVQFTCRKQVIRMSG